MNAEKSLLEVEGVIKLRKPNYIPKWSVCWLEGRIQCVPEKSILNDGNVFGTFTDDDLNNGLTLKQWELLKKAIALFFERKNQCPKSPKP